MGLLKVYGGNRWVRTLYQVLDLGVHLFTLQIINSLNYLQTDNQRTILIIQYFFIFTHNYGFYQILEFINIRNFCLFAERILICLQICLRKHAIEISYIMEIRTIFLQELCHFLQILNFLFYRQSIC